MSDNRCCNHHNVFCFLRQAEEIAKKGVREQKADMEERLRYGKCWKVILGESESRQILTMLEFLYKIVKILVLQVAEESGKIHILYNAGGPVPIC